MISVGLHFRAIQQAAKRRHLVGAIPTFNVANRPPRRVYGLLLIPREVAEFRDVPAADLGNPELDDFGARLRAVQTYAKRAGFPGGVPTFNTAGAGAGLKHGTLLLRPATAEWRDVPVRALGAPAPNDIGARFRSLQSYATSNGFIGGFPNFFEGHPAGTHVYGSILIPAASATFEDVPATDLPAGPDDPAGFFRAAQHYATGQGYVGAIPTFHQAQRGGFVCGAVVLDANAAEWRDVPIDQLGGPASDADPGHALRSAHDLATELGYVGGFPTFYQATTAGKRVGGIVLLKAPAATWFDVPAKDLGDPPLDDLPARFRAAQHYAVARKAVGALPNAFHARHADGRVDGTIVLGGIGVRFVDFGIDEVYTDEIVRGPIRECWMRNGGPSGPYGLPTSDEQRCRDAIGRRNTFEHGDIYRNPAGGGFGVLGAIRDTWNALGAENSYLGYPVSDERPWAGTAGFAGRITDFEFGSIVLDRDGPVVQPATTTATYAVTTPALSALEGSVDMTLASDGNFNFKLSMRAVGAFSYDFALNPVYAAPSGACISPGLRTGSVYGTFDAGNRSWDDEVAGNAPQIRSEWRDTPGGALDVLKQYERTGLLGVPTDVARGLLDATSAAVGAAAGVVFWVGGAIGDLLPSLGIGETFGVVAGVVVFVYGGGGIAGLVLAVAGGAVVGAVTNEMIEQRELTVPERGWLDRVFTGTIDYGDVRLTNLSGLGGHPFTAKGLDGRTYVNVGTEGFAEPIKYVHQGQAPGRLFVHEMTHAWQLQHGLTPSVICHGIINQVDKYIAVDDPYPFGPPGPPWSAWNLEQQASIVGHWFTRTNNFNADGSDDPYYPYIRDNVRRGVA